MERLTERTADGILVKENYEKESLKTLYSCYGEKPNSYYSNCEEGYCAMEEVQKYLAIGAPEEFRAAVKQTAKKPIFNHNLSDTLSVFHCECGNTIKVSHDIGIMNNNNAPNYCSKCGQKLDWSDEE